MGTRLDPTANERTAYIDSLCQILTYARGPEEISHGLIEYSGGL